MKAEETVCFNIKTAWHGIYRMYNSIAAKHSSTTSVGFVLLNIDAEKGTPATKIAPLIGLESRSLTRTLKNLEDAGIIYRQADPHDKRLVRIFLTPLGKEKREAARQAVLNFNHLVRQKIAPEKLAVFFEVINEVMLASESEKNITV
jgi:DNA-binding MarR family transcriptional regulator